MTRHSPRKPSPIGNFLDTVGSLLEVTRATRAHRQPKASDLRAIGIDPDQFRRIGRS